MFRWQSLSTMLLMVGLGNPGEKYQNTRHNIGTLVLRGLFPDAGLKFDKQLNAFKGETEYNQLKIVLLFPQTFMNLSGDAVSRAMKFFSISPENLVIFHDEIDLEPGKIVYKFDGGHRGHNGLRDIIAKINTPAFHRIRIGVGRPVNGSVADYVLSRIGENAFPDLKDAIEVLDRNIFSQKMAGH